MCVSGAAYKNAGLTTWNLLVKLPCELSDKTVILLTDLCSREAEGTHSFPARLALLQVQHQLCRKLLPGVLLEVARL